jgi:hypothetical protein
MGAPDPRVEAVKQAEIKKQKGLTIEEGKSSGPLCRRKNRRYRK